MTYEPLDRDEPDADRYLRQVIDLLTEIRDRLPDPRPQGRTSHGEVSMVGYVMGSGAIPSEGQVAYARAFLDGSLFRDSPHAPVYPAIARDLALEIVRMAEK